MHPQGIDLHAEERSVEAWPSALTMEWALLRTAVTLPQLLQRRIETAPNQIAYRQFDAPTGRWERFTWADIGRLVTCWRSALIASKVMRGDRIGLLLPNGLDWVCSDQATLALGAVVVPLYATDSPRNWAYQLDHADVRLVVLNHVDQWRQIAAEAPELTSLTSIIVTERWRAEDSDDPRLALLDDWLPQVGDPGPPKNIVPDDLATIIYTSGTTGQSKGVMLSHRNILAAVGVGPESGAGLCQRRLSVLPPDGSRFRANHGLLPSNRGRRRGRIRPLNRKLAGRPEDRQADDHAGRAADLRADLCRGP